MASSIKWNHPRLDRLRLFPYLMIGFLMSCSGKFINPDKPVELMVASHSPTIALGQSLQLKLYLVLTDGTLVDQTDSATWRSDNPAIAKIVSPGLIQSLAMGRVGVNVSAQGFTTSTSLSVTAAQGVSLAVTSSSASVALGASMQMKAVETYTDATTQDVSASAKWTTSLPALAVVGPDGLLTAKALGAVTVTAQVGALEAASQLTVTPAALASLQIFTDHTQIPAGETQQWTAIGTFTDGSTQDVTASVTWTSSQSNVASISPGGTLIAKAIGSTMVGAAVGPIGATRQLTVTPSVLASLAVSSSRNQVPLGLTQQFNAIGVYTDGSIHDLTSSATWTSSQPGVAPISGAGLATAKTLGSTAITAQIGTNIATSQLTVTEAAIVSLAVSASRSSISLGSTQQFTAIGSYTDGSTHDVTAAATWISSQPSVATVAAGGLVSTKATGAVTISAQVDAAGGMGQLNVTPAELVSLVVHSGSSTIPLGLTQQLNATGTFTDGTTRDLTAAVTWTSSQPGIALVSPGGLVTAKAIGSATMSAQAGGIAAATLLSIAPAALVSLAINPLHAVIPIGSTQQFTAIGTYTDGSTQDQTDAVAWSASPSSIVSVSASGAAKSVGLGTAIVQCQLGSVTASSSLQTSRPVLQSITIYPAQSLMLVGTSQQLTAQGSFSDGSTQDMTDAVAWSSGSSDVLSVTGAGQASANAVGTALVSATSLNLGISGTMEFSVSPSLPLSSISIFPDAPTILMGRTLPLKATGLYIDGSSADITLGVTWMSNDPGIVQVTTDGVAVPLKVGSTNVQASMNGVNTSVPLVVQPVALTTYFTDDTTLPDTTVHMSNPGSSVGTICAMLYVFDKDQQMAECCGCVASADGLRTLSVQTDLNDNPLTGVRSTTGTLMLVPADYGGVSSCDASSITPDGVEIAWATHLQGSANSFAVSEAPFAAMPLSPTLSLALQAQCQFIQQLGSGQGICRCGTGD